VCSLRMIVWSKHVERFKCFNVNFRLLNTIYVHLLVGVIKFSITSRYRITVIKTYTVLCQPRLRHFFWKGSILLG